METILFILFLVGIQVVGALVEAQKKKRQYGEQMKRAEQSNRTETAVNRPETAKSEWEYGEEHEEEEWETVTPSAPTPPPFTHPDPSPVPDGWDRLQEILRRMGGQEEPLPETAPPAKSKQTDFDMPESTPRTPAPPLPSVAYSPPMQHRIPVTVGIREERPPLDSSRLKEAVLYSEILGHPKALRSLRRSR